MKNGEADNLVNVNKKSYCWPSKASKHKKTIRDLFVFSYHVTNNSFGLLGPAQLNI